MKTSFIYNILNSQQILIKFALKLFVRKCQSFQTHILLDLHFPLIILSRTKYNCINLPVLKGTVGKAVPGGPSSNLSIM